MKLAVIDIGSNAARLLITEVIENKKQQPVFNKLNLIRVPLRLGFDVFETGIISTQKIDMLIQTLKAFRHLLNAYQVAHIKACATSAMRDTKNAANIIIKVKKETGINIEIISGDTESAIIYESHIAENLNPHHHYLYIDVGGGSTELTLFGNQQLIVNQSFNIGTIRLLKNKVSEDCWNNMKLYVKQHIRKNNNIIGIGAGGNINKLFSLSKKKEGKPLELDMLKAYYKNLSTLTLPERMKLYDLREDRADVIVPALQIYLTVMRWAKIDKIYVPKIGLADGLVQHLYNDVYSKM